jgi:hypothetical protein
MTTSDQIFDSNIDSFLGACYNASESKETWINYLRSELLNLNLTCILSSDKQLGMIICTNECTALNSLSVSLINVIFCTKTSKAINIPERKSKYVNISECNTSAICKKIYEGFLIFMFYFDDEWKFATERHINAKEELICNKSAYDRFTGIYDLNVTKFDKQRSYTFIVHDKELMHMTKKDTSFCKLIFSINILTLEKSQEDSEIIEINVHRDIFNVENIDYIGLKFNNESMSLMYMFTFYIDFSKRLKKVLYLYTPKELCLEAFISGVEMLAHISLVVPNFYSLVKELDKKLNNYIIFIINSMNVRDQQLIRNKLISTENYNMIILSELTNLKHIQSQLNININVNFIKKFLLSDKDRLKLILS